MLLDEAGLLGRVRIVASDISERVLARAREGQFSPRSLRALPAGVEGRWITRVGDRVEVRPSLARAIDWRRVNLLDSEAVSALGRFHAVLARNVLIYFADDTIRRVVSGLSDALLPGGLLLVGAAESLLRYGTSLACEEHGGAFFYRKVA